METLEEIEITMRDIINLGLVGNGSLPVFIEQWADAIKAHREQPDAHTVLTHIVDEELGYIPTEPVEKLEMRIREALRELILLREENQELKLEIKWLT